MVIKLDSKYILRVLFILFAFLLLANILGIIHKLSFPSDSQNYIVKSIINLIDFDDEKNLPTLYSTALLFSISILLWLISLKEKKANNKYISWLLLSIVFFYLTLDEILSFHEHLVVPFRNTFDATGMFYFAWVIPYGVAVLIGFLISFKFLLRLPKRIYKLFILAGIVYLFGAIGMEMIGGSIAESKGMENIIFYLVYTIEESLEMLGLIIFIYSLLNYYDFKILVDNNLNSE